jgi:endonuclease/exonuclease/phosphatase family metal-dependent hydrolase
VHFIAIPTDPARCAQREAQAVIIRNVISGYLQKQYGVIVVGDMNDYDNDTLDVNNHRPISGVLSILKGDTTAYGIPSGEPLYTVMDEILPIERYSDWWDSDSNCNTESVYDYSMIDHLLVSKQILPYITRVFVYHGYPEYCGKYDSDHFPLVVDFGTIPE